MSIEDRLVEDPEFYVKVQKAKILVAVLMGAIALLMNYFSGLNHMTKYRVSGHCAVPMFAEIEVEASNEAGALRIAKAAWNKDHIRLLTSGSEDEAAAYDWQPVAELLTGV